MSRKLESFAAGLLTGYANGKMGEKKRLAEEERMQLEAENMRLRNEQMGLEVTKAQDEKALRAELKGIDAAVKPTEAYILQTPQGNVVYNDRQLADAAAGELGAESGARVTDAFIVNGRPYATSDEASSAAEALNSPAARNRRRAEVAMKYNQPQLAQQFTQAYQAEVEANRAEMMDVFNRAKATGDLNAAAEVYNSRMARNGQVRLSMGDDGQVVAERLQGDKVIGTRPMGTPEQFWEQTGQMVMATPANALELWKSQKGLALQERQVATQERTGAAQVRVADANVAKTNMETAQMPAELGLKAQQVQASLIGAGAAASNAQTQRMHLTQPKVSAVPDAQGNLSFVQVPQEYNATTGSWGLQAPQVQSVPGARYPGIATAEARRPPGLEALMPQQSQIDWGKVGSALSNLPAKNIGGPQPGVPQQPASGTFPALGQTPLSPELLRQLQLQQQTGR